MFSGNYKKDCETMLGVLSKYKYYVGSTRSKMLYVKPGNGSVLFGTTWKGYLTTKADGTKVMRERVRGKKGKFYTNFRRDNPELEPILKEFRDLYFSHFDYNQVTINKNFPCPPHFDSKNCGESVLVAFGHYNGGKTCLFKEGKIEKYDARIEPLQFNGSEILHWVEPTRATGKDRYSLVFYNH